MTAPVGMAVVVAAGTVDYPQTLVRLLIDLLALTALVGALFLPRHERRDLAVVYVAFNIALFAVSSVISVRAISVGVGFGLFAVLSIVRLRSEPFNNVELAYFFLALVLGLINGLSEVPLPFVAALNVLIVLSIYVSDHSMVHATTFRRTVTLDEIHTDVERLRLLLEERLGIRISDLRIDSNDFVRETTHVTLSYVEGNGSAHGPYIKAADRLERP